MPQLERIAQTKAFELRFVVAAIRSHDGHLADRKRRMHDFIFKTYLQHPIGYSIGTFAKTHLHHDLRADRVFKTPELPRNVR